MKKQTTQILNKSMSVLKKEAESLRVELAKLKLNAHANPQKNTNLKGKKIKELAVLLTAIRQKEIEEAQNG